MIRKNWLFIGILSIVLVFSMVLVFTTCSAGSADGDDTEPPPPQSVTYVSYDDDGNRYTLKITENTARYAAQVGDTFTFTVEKYETDQSYTELLAKTGTVESIENNGTTIAITVNEEPLIITVSGAAITAISGDIKDEEGGEVIQTPQKLDPPDENGEWIDPYPVEKPVITEQSGTKRYTIAMNPKLLSVSVAAVEDGGTLTYQWYSAPTFATTGGTEVENQTALTYQPTGGSVGTTYYYLIVTNSKTYTPDGADPIVRIATTASAPMGVIVIENLPNVAATVTVTATQNQYVRGFGGMSNGFNLTGTGVRYMEMRDIETMFGPNGLGLKILRIMIYPYTLRQVTSGQVEPQMRHATTYLNVVKKVNEYGGYVLASPWTAPAHYKTNESLSAGGHLKTTMYVDYANYLRAFATDMAANDAPVYAVSIQNEPSLTVGYDGMEWTEAEHRNFFRDVAQYISRSPTAVPGYGGGAPTPFVKVVSGEAHQIGGWYTSAMDAIIANPQAHNNMDMVAYHIYGGSGTKASVTRNGTLNRETWMTEYNINSGNEAGYVQDQTWNYVWLFAETIHNTIGNNDSSGFVWWYLKRFYGVIGDGAFGSPNGGVMPRGHVLSHYAKYATDTVRVDATTTHPMANSGNIRLTAFQRKSVKSNAVEQQVLAVGEDSYSVVIYDQRTSSGAETSLRINLPAGFEASEAFGIISDPTRRRAPVNVVLNPDGNSADVSLPTNAIISLKFVK